MKTQNLDVTYLFNLKEGCGLHFKINVEGEKCNYVCPYKECDTHDDALNYFKEKFMKDYHKNKKIYISHEVISTKDMDQLSLAC